MKKHFSYKFLHNHIPCGQYTVKLSYENQFHFQYIYIYIYIYIICVCVCVC